MKSFTLFLCVMLVAVACAGNSNKKADEQPAGDPETEQIQTNFVPVPVPKGSEGIAFKAYEQILLTKMDEYDKAGLRDGLDIIYTSEFGQGSFDVDAAYGKIAGIILTQSLHI